MRTATAQLGGFKKFLLRGNVVDLAVGVVIGAAFGSVVQALVKDIITPLLGAAGGTPDFSTWAVQVGSARLLIGDFLNALISFLLIATVIYFLVVLPVSKLMERYRSEPTPSPTKECPECLSKIPEAARRCMHCSAQLEQPSEAVINVMQRMAGPSGEDVANEAARVLTERLKAR
jgi:large conductance mechanosensitive channel